MNKVIEHRWKWDYLFAIGKIEQVPIEWLKKFKLPNVTYITTDSHGKVVDMKQLKKHIVEEGLVHACVLEVSRNSKRVRIIAGNHRLEIAEDLQRAYCPFYVMIRDEFECPDFGDGIDYSEKLTSIVEETKGDVVAAPSEVFTEIAYLKSKDLLV